MYNSLEKIQIGGATDTIRIIGGRGYDIRQPLPVQYPEVRQRFLNARQNFWTPNDIPMGEDKLQWNTHQLTEAEEWLFKINISYLTAADNLVPDNITDAILCHITANEMRQYLRWQVAEEANHLESYLFILESFGLDEKGQGQIFNLYREVPALTQKLDWNIEFTRCVANCPHPYTTPEAKQAFLEDLLSYYIFEFLFFPLGFSQIFAMARQGKLKNTAEQYAYIWRDENLHAINTLWLIKQVISENPVMWNVRVRERARAIVDEAVKLETAYAHASMPNGGILGLSVESYSRFAQFMGDRICEHLGLPPLFNIGSHPLPWMTEFELSKEKGFFETRVMEYRKGAALTW